MAAYLFGLAVAFGLGWVGHRRWLAAQLRHYIRSERER